MRVVRFVLELRLGWEMVLVIRILLARAEALPEFEVLPVLGDFFLVLEKSRICLRFLLLLNLFLPVLNQTVLFLNLILLVLLVLLLLPTDYSLWGLVAFAVVPVMVVFV